MRKITFLLFAVALVMSCGQKGNDKKSEKATINYIEMDLSEYDIPVKLTVPEGAKVNESIIMTMFSGFGLLVYEVKKDNFILEVTCAPNDSITSPEERMELAKNEVASEDGFDSFVEEEDFGYIYKSIKESDTDYNFYYVFRSGNSLIEFSNGMRFSNFSLDEVKEHYKAAQTAH